MESKSRSLFHAVGRRRFGRWTCFLCGRCLTQANRSDEHIFPKWVQARFSLWDQKLTLLNGTQIPYRSLTIPCCRDCNLRHLSPIENKVRTATLKGYKGVSALDELTLFLWLGKIFYGLLYKESFLVTDRKSRRKTPIVSKRLMKAHSLHHLFLQAARLPFEFIPSLPASVFVFKLEPPKDVRFKWDFRDTHPLMTMACRIGEVGLLTSLQDGGAQRDSKQVPWRRFQKLRLHPLQFTELSAAFFYSASLVNRVPKFLIAESVPVQVVQCPLQGMSMKPIFDDWNQEAFATRFFAPMIGLPLETIFQPSKGVVSWLHEGRRVRRNQVQGPDSGRFHGMPLDQLVWVKE